MFQTVANELAAEMALCDIDTLAKDLKFADAQGLEFPLIADTSTELLNRLVHGVRKWLAVAEPLAHFALLTLSMRKESLSVFSLQKR